MTILLVLIPIGLVLLAAAIAAFLWAVRSDQFEDLDRQGEQILFGDEVHSAKAPGSQARVGKEPGR